MTVKVNWGNQTIPMPMRSVWECEHYVVDPTPDATPDGKSVRLLLDDGKHDILLGPGSRTFVMNERGATVDTIFV